MFVYVLLNHFLQVILQFFRHFIFAFELVDHFSGRLAHRYRHIADYAIDIDV